jgi:small subunit ribosomal protein S2
MNNNISVKSGINELAKDGLISSVVKDLIEARAYLGYNPSRTNPKIHPFVVGDKSNLEIINLDKTEELLSQAEEFIKKLGKEKKKLLFVGSNPTIKNLIEKYANQSENPFVNGRWSGGLLTNFKTLFNRLKYFWDLREKKEKGELLKYTKKEQVDFDRQIEKLSALFNGLDSYDKLPDCLIIVNTNIHDIALQEAKKTKIPVIAIINTDSNPNDVSYPIVASDHIPSSVEYILKKLVDSYIKGKEEGVSEEKNKVN